MVVVEGGGGEVVCNVTVHKTGLSLRNWENPEEFPLLRAERQGRSQTKDKDHQSRCHGLSTPSRISYFWHRKSRKITVLSHACRAFVTRL